MTASPTVDQFPSFVKTLSWLKDGACRCIWYLPNKGRCCSKGIDVDANQSMLSLAKSVFRACPLTRVTQVKLVQVAENSCCDQYHCNRIHGNELSQRLALRWLQDLRTAGSIPTGPSVFAPPTVIPNKPVTFTKRRFGTGDTLGSQLVSLIDHRESLLGSVYIFTYRLTVFSEMIKVGYTSRELALRMEEHSACGYGYPQVLTSWTRVRHPKRVETLTHYELMEYWYAHRWCKFHGQPHIEWFKINVGTASAVADLWARWMKRANPYDRRGHKTDVERCHPLSDDVRSSYHRRSND